MNNRKRLPPWHEHFRLPNGRELLIRPIRPEDAEPIQGAFALLGPDEVRHRFLYTLKELSPEMAHALCHPDPRTQFALVAAEDLPPGEALVGAVARTSIIARTRDADVQHGIGPLPCKRLRGAQRRLDGDRRAWCCVKI